MRAHAVLFAAILALVAAPVAADTLKSVADSGTLKIGYRADAPPFASRSEIGEPEGYSVDLCRAVAADVKTQLRLDKIDVSYVPVTAETRFTALESGEIDILCGATTVTLQRRESMDFSLLTYATGASVMFRREGPSGFDQLEGKKVGVVKNTTTEDGLFFALAEIGINAEIMAVDGHQAGIAALRDGDIAAYFADRALLVHMLGDMEDRAEFVVSDRFFSFEPYALAMRPGDAAFRLLVDSTLSRLYRTGRIFRIYRAAFGIIQPSDLLRAMYVLQAVPE